MSDDKARETTGDDGELSEDALETVAGGDLYTDLIFEASMLYVKASDWVNKQVAAAAPKIDQQ